MTKTVAAALAEARRDGIASLDAQLMLARIIGATRTGLIADDSRALSASEAEHWRSWLGRRGGGEPLAYLLGEKEFYGMTLEVGPAVLVPRPETELLVDWAAALVGSELPAAARVADLGTGSGAIALALKRLRPEVTVVASDLSEAALAVARRNAVRQRLDVDFVRADWWQGFATDSFELILGNPPYVSEGDPHLAELRHEPALALAAGADGLAALTTIVSGAPDHLRRGGWLLLEHGSTQAAEVAASLRAAGFVAVESRRDLAGLDRVTGGRLRGAGR